MITVTFCMRLKTEILSVFFDNIIKSLDFKPDKMDIYYNEFSTPKFFIKYNSNLLNALSLSELDGGVTSFSLYDNRYTNERITPFFRVKILDTTFSNKQVVCLFEWVSYSKLYFDLDVLFLSNYLSDETKIIFLIAYNQLDGIAGIEKQNYFKRIFSSQAKWGKRIFVNSIPFIAAPVMFFGNEYYSIIPKDVLLKVPNSQELIVKGQEVIAISLFDLYDNPNLHRNTQKKYWQITSLSQRIKKYEKEVFSVDAVMQYENRYQKIREQKNKKRYKYKPL